MDLVLQKNKGMKTLLKMYSIINGDYQTEVEKDNMNINITSNMNIISNMNITLTPGQIAF